MRAKKNDKHEAFVEGSGNVFADLGLPNADELLVKADLMSAIVQEIERRNLTEHQAAALTGITQLEVSQIAQGKMEAFSLELERLVHILRDLEVDVEINLHRRESGGDRALDSGDFFRSGAPAFATVHARGSGTCG